MNLINFAADKKLDCIAVGRLCIDLNANEINRPMEQTMSFTKYVGGSPANITIGLSRLGMNTGFIGKVSDDQMGRYITNYLEDNHIDTSMVAIDTTGAMTGLTFTEIKSPTDCSILMYRDNAADLKLEPDEVNEDYIKSARALLISGTALAQSPSREAVFKALDIARRHGVVVVFDLDYRPYTWKSKEETAVYYSLVAEKCDCILGTREEFDMMENLIAEASDDDRSARKWFDYHAQIVVIKHGKDGSKAYDKQGGIHHAGIFPAKVIKTFGAGDAFASSFIYGLMKGWDIQKCLELGSVSASIVISRHSCSDAMPTYEEIQAYMEKCNAEE